MVKKFLISLSIIILPGILHAQDSTAIFIEAGRDVSEVLTPEKIYEFPNFADGVIMFKDGTSARNKLNYNYLMGEVMFISPDNDTLAIAKNQMLNISKIQMGSKTFFYYDHGYLELIDEAPFGKLLKKQVLTVKKREKIGGYNQPTSTTAIDSYASFTDDNGVITSNLKVREDITLVLTSFYFIGDTYNYFLPASKKNALRLFSLKKPGLKTYLDQNAVDFWNLQSLQKMFTSLHW